MTRLLSTRYTRLTAATFLALGLSACTPDQPPAGQAGAEAPAKAPEAVVAPVAAVVNAVKPSWRPIKDVPAGVASSNCHIDNIGGVEGATSSRIKHGDALNVSGWIATSDGTAVPEAITLRLEDGTNGRVWEIPVSAGVPRQDVADATGTVALAQSGFAVAVDTAELALEAKHVYLAFKQGDKQYICDGGHQVVIE